MPAIATPIKPALIRWAVGRTGKTVPDLAKGLSVKEEQVNEWLNGEKQIPLAKAQQLAESALVPLPLLYLPQVPNTTPKLADFRTTGNKSLQRPSPELEATIRMAEVRQAWYRDYLVFNGHEPLKLVGSVKRNAKADEAAAQICKTLGLYPGFTVDAHDARDAVRIFLEHLDSAGILVMRNGILGNNTRRPLDPNEFRGFALADEYAPLVFINTADAQSAQLFTIAHEVVHIFQGARGVSGQTADNDAERFCNRVAAEILAPSALVMEKWRKAKGNVQDRISALATAFHLSLQAMLLCARTLDLLTADQFQTIWTHATAILDVHKGGGNFYVILKNRVCPSFARAVIIDTQNGRTPYLEAFKLLSVKNRQAMEQLLGEVGV